MSTTARPHVNIVGSGPNGLTTEAMHARAGWQVRVIERNDIVGGAAASADIFGDGSIVDLGAAAHPFGVASPVFRHLELEKYGLEWLHSDYPLAHPFDDHPAAILHRDVRTTARGLGIDSTAWRLIHRRRPGSCAPRFGKNPHVPYLPVPRRTPIRRWVTRLPRPTGCCFLHWV